MLRQAATSTPIGRQTVAAKPQHPILPRHQQQRQQQRPAALPDNAAASRALAGAAAVALALSAAAGPAFAANREKVGEFAASGLLFKDTVEVVALDDPDVPGATLYLSEFKRSLADKVAKDFFSGELLRGGGLQRRRHCVEKGFGFMWRLCSADALCRRLWERARRLVRRTATALPPQKPQPKRNKTRQQQTNNSS